MFCFLLYRNFLTILYIRGRWNLLNGVLFLIYYLFNDAVTKSIYVASKDMLINELWITKDMEGDGRGVI
jgi:hypothetical protein